MHVHRLASGLHQENVGTAHVLLNLDISFAIGKARDPRVAAGQSKKMADFVTERLVSRAAEDLELIVHTGRLKLTFRLLVRAHPALLLCCRKGRHFARSSWPPASRHLPTVHARS